MGMQARERSCLRLQKRVSASASALYQNCRPPVVLSSHHSSSVQNSIPICSRGMWLAIDRWSIRTFLALRKTYRVSVNAEEGVGVCERLVSKLSITDCTCRILHASGHISIHIGIIETWLVSDSWCVQPFTSLHKTHHASSP